MVKRIAMVLAALACLWGASGADGLADRRVPELRYFSIHNRPAGELLPEVQKLLSPSGRAYVDDVANRIAVQDYEANLDAIAVMLKKMTLPIIRIRIQARRVTQQELEHQDLGVTWFGTWLGLDRGAIAGNAILQGNAPTVTITDRMTDFIGLNDTQPDVAWLIANGYLPDGTYQEAAYGLLVNPEIHGAQVELTLTPALRFRLDKAVSTTVFTDSAQVVTLSNQAAQVIAPADRDGLLIQVLGQAALVAPNRALLILTAVIEPTPRQWPQLP